VDHFEKDGYALADFVLTDLQCAHLASSLPEVAGNTRGGVRNLIQHPTVIALLAHARLSRYLRSLTGREPVAVKATLFDKTGDANWRVQWHQDRTIAVRERIDVEGFGPWSTKAGTLHVAAPHEVLAQMLAIRIHLDDCGADNGPLRVIPGSHRHGKIAEADLEGIVARSHVAELHVPRGALLLMRPLLVHSSPAARTPGHRRVLHIELAPFDLISPLQWHETTPLHRAA
jgi:ectoine hydroxylase-related dioxygenase (phytanoyl-CoA dioxygenase family)